MRENIITFKPTSSIAGQVQMKRNPEAYSWDPFNETQHKVFQEAQRLRILLVNPLEICALAKALQQRSEENLRSLEICFLACSEAEFGTMSEGDGLPARFWTKFESAIQALKQVPADLVTFTCHQFANETRRAYRYEKRKLDARVMFSAEYTDMSPRLKGLCVPIGEAMMELAKTLAQKKKKRSGEEDDGDDQAALQRKRVRQDITGREIDALDICLPNPVDSDTISAETSHESSGVEVNGLQAEQRSIFGLPQETPTHEAERAFEPEPARDEQEPVSKKRAYSDDVSADDRDVVRPQPKRQQLHTLSTALTAPAAWSQPLPTSIPNVPSTLSQVTSINDVDDLFFESNKDDVVTPPKVDAETDELAAELLAEMEKERDLEAEQYVETADNCRRTEEEMDEWAAELEAMMTGDAEDEVEGCAEIS
jgi:hypothetical protein